MKPRKVDAPRVKPGDVAGFLNILRKSHSLPAEEVERLRESASGAIRDPRAVFSSCKESLQDRGIDEPQSDVYVFVLLDGLISLRVVAEIDWKSLQEDVIWAIEQISAETKKFALDPIAGRDTASTLSAIGSVIDRRGKRLLQWKTDSDSYCVMVVKHQFVDEAIRAASRLKIILTPKIR